MKIDGMFNLRKFIAFVLAVLMLLLMNVADVFGVPDVGPIFTCTKCGKEVSWAVGEYNVSINNIYGVDSIPGLNTYLIKTFVWNYCTEDGYIDTVNNICATCVDNIAQAYLATLNRITTAGGTGTIPLVVSTEIPTFSVTVPTSLPVTVQSNGTVVVSNACKIVNNGPGVVEITNIQVNNSGDWNLLDFNTDFDSLPSGNKSFGINLFSNNVQNNGTCDVSTISQINGKSNIKVDYDVKIAPQTQAISSTIANVVFTVSWKLAPINYINFQIGGTTYQAEEGMTWGSWVNSEYNTGLGTDSIVVDNGKVGIETSTGSSSTVISHVGYSGVPVSITDSIIDGHTYTTITVPVVNLISFSIDGVAYQALEGMSWYEWIDSKYNTDGYGVWAPADSVADPYIGKYISGGVTSSHSAYSGINHAYKIFGTGAKIKAVYGMLRTEASTNGGLITANKNYTTYTVQDNAPVG